MKKYSTFTPGGAEDNWALYGFEREMIAIFHPAPGRKRYRTFNLQVLSTLSVDVIVERCWLNKRSIYQVPGIGKSAQNHPASAEKLTRLAKPEPVGMLDVDSEVLDALTTLDMYEAAGIATIPRGSPEDVETPAAGAAILFKKKNQFTTEPNPVETRQTIPFLVSYIPVTCNFSIQRNYLNHRSCWKISNEPFWRRNDGFDQATDLRPSRKNMTKTAA